MKIFSSVALGQTNLLSFDGVNSSEHLGRVVAKAQDLNSDGVVDYLISSISDNLTNSVKIVSGSSGGVLFNLTGSSQSGFGKATIGLGDVNDDGYGDFAISAPDENYLGVVASGRVYVYSGQNGFLLFSIGGAQANGHFGAALETLSDLNNDGKPDFIVGAVGEAKVYVVSGSNGNIINFASGQAANDSFGVSLAALGDIDSDGKDDFIVGALNYAQVISGNGLGILYSKSIVGLALVANRAGDFLVGVFDPADLSVGAGFSLYSKIDGGVLHYFPGHFSTLGAIGNDIVAADPSAGTVTVFSGLTYNPTQTLTGSSSSLFGASLVGLGDFNGDGTPEIVVGAPNALQNQKGQAFLYSTASLNCPSVVELGPGCGSLSMSITPPLLGSFAYAYGADEPNRVVRIVASGVSLQPVQFTPQCIGYLNLNDLSEIDTTIVDSNGNWQIPPKFIPFNTIAGGVLYVQAYSGTSFSDLHLSPAYAVAAGACPLPTSSPLPSPSPISSPTPTASPSPSPLPSVIPSPSPSPTTPPFGNYNPPSNLDPTVPYSISDATSFLYQGSNPIQTGVVPGTIEARRVAVLRGKVLDPSGLPLAGVTVKILNHPELGQTITRSDGMFDMAVNGGGLLTVDYSISGYLSVQRQIKTPWRDFVVAPDVMLTMLDTAVTQVDLSLQTTMQAHSANVVTDRDGTRTARVLIPAGTTALLKMPGGITQPINTISVRATEYTVGVHGPKKMPGTLPPTSGYTYAVELSVDEAIAAGATEVAFSQALPFYVDNFLNFPIGTVVPLGSYDRIKATWIPSSNGKVIKVVSIVSGQAVISLDTNDTPATAAELNTLGITTEELQSIATLYAVGASFWRVRLAHFSAYDLNWPYGPPADAVSPNQPPPKSGDKDNPDDPCLQGGSIIECENQILQEEIPIVGTSFSLQYSSGRQKGRAAARKLNISLSGATVPASLTRIDLNIEVAGKHISQSFSPQTNLSTTYMWDGFNAYGQELFGTVPCVVSIAYVYDANYLSPAIYENAFALPSSTFAVLNEARQEFVFVQEAQTTLQNLDNRALGIGGWQLSAHGVYDSAAQELYINGKKDRINPHLNGVISIVAGNGSYDPPVNGSLATETGVASPLGIAIGSDGSLYIAGGPVQVYKVSPNGILTTVAGLPTFGAPLGDGGPATQAGLRAPFNLAVADDGTFYIADAFDNRVRRVSTDGIISTVAGNGDPEYFPYIGDNVLATQTNLFYPNDVALANDGGLLIADTHSNRIRKVGLDGIIRSVVGTGIQGASDINGVPAAQANLIDPSWVTTAPDGGFYLSSNFAPYSDGRIRKVSVDGLISTVAGNGPMFFTEGAQAYQIYLSSLDLTPAPDGGYFITSGSSIFKVSADGIITTLAGSGMFCCSANPGMLASQAFFGYVRSIATAPDGSLYIADYYNNFVYRVAPALPGFSEGTQVIASKDGRLVYQFDSRGRHFSTKSTLTGQAFYSFSYDTNGHLTQITDGDGDVSFLNYDSSGNLSSIVGPFGQATQITIGSDGYLSDVVNPNAESRHFSYNSDGLMTAMTDPNGSIYQYAYDVDGRLTLDQEPTTSGGLQTLSRTSIENANQSSFAVRRTTGLGRITDYLVEQLSSGDVFRRTTNSDGTSVDTIIATNGTYHTVWPDGMVLDRVLDADPRFGMQSPIDRTVTVRTPSNLTLNLGFSRSVALASPGDPLSLLTLTEASIISHNNQSLFFFQDYNATNGTTTYTTPLNRQATTISDLLGRLTQITVPNFDPINFVYDSHGRLSTVIQGSTPNDRVVQLAYDPASGYLTNISDPLLQQTSYQYDLAGRITLQTLPDGRVIQFGYDANGNLISLTPPGRPPHVFQYNAIDNGTSYTAPSVSSGGSNQTTYDYNIDRQLTAVTRPDGQQIILNYNGATGKLENEVAPSGSTFYGYNISTGQLNSISGPYGETINYSYDGSLLTETGWSGSAGITGSVQRGYDDNFRLSSLSVNSGSPIVFGYDNDSLLTSAGALTLTRSPVNGILTGTSLAGGAGLTLDTYTYNSFAEMEDYNFVSGSAPTFHEQITLRDKLGRIVDKTETVQGVTDTYHYDYDLSGRLYQVTQNGSVVSSYTYDSNSNRLSNAITGATGTYDNQDRLLSYDNLAFTYTANGELVTKVAPAGTTTYNYDVYGSLLSVALPSGDNINYVIDGLGRRVGKKVNGVLQKGWLYQDELRPIAELDSSGAVALRFIYASKSNVPDYFIKNSINYRIVSDHLGSVRLVVNLSTGAIAQRLDYDEFGVVLTDTNPGFQPFGFAGGLYDPDTKLVRFGARDYDAVVGRWTSKDPIGFDGGDTNLFGYVIQDPVNYVDPFGQEGFVVDYVGGFGSYFRGLFRTLRHDARAIGLSGKCERRRAARESAILRKLSRLLFEHAELQRLAREEGLKYLGNHKARVAGRFTAALLTGAGVSSFSPLAGPGLSVLAINGDLRHAIEVGRQEIDSLVRAALGGEVGGLGSADSCKCN